LAADPLLVWKTELELVACPLCRNEVNIEPLSPDLKTLSKSTAHFIAVVPRPHGLTLPRLPVSPRNTFYLTHPSPKDCAITIFTVVTEKPE